MFRTSPMDSAQDARLQRLLGMVEEELIAIDQTAVALKFDARGRFRGWEPGCVIRSGTRSRSLSVEEGGHVVRDMAI